MDFHVGLTMALLVTMGISRLALGAEPNYEFQQINVPGSAHTSAHGLNNHGDIVGVYDTGGFPSGFLLKDGVFTTITVPGSILTTALGINNAGDIVGDFVDITFTEHGYLLRKGKFTVIDFPGAVATDRLAINDQGDIVGAYFTADNTDVAHGFLLTRDGTFKVVAYPGAIESGGSGINARGDIVGTWDNDIFSNFHGFLLSQGKFLNLDYPGAIGELGGSSAVGINSHSQVVGVFVDLDGGHGYFWQNGVFSPIDAPAGVAGTTGVFGINDAGRIVGKYLDPTLGHRVGFVATPVRP
jgi:uncharacterized membrane protein